MTTMSGEVAPSPNGIAFPRKYKNWPVLSISHRVDQRTMRVVVGNLTAIRAARSGQTNPWPDGTIIGSVLWEQQTNKASPTSLTADKFIRAEFMFKDVQAYAGNTSGWGWARWTGTTLQPYGETQDFEEECIACHKTVSGSDWLFSTPVVLP